MIPKDHKYTLKWPEGAELKMDERHIGEIRASLEIQFKYLIYKQPGFKFFHSLGNTNFFQHFKTNDGIDFGVCHLYWDKNASDNIDYVDKDGKIVDKQGGGWRIRWLKPGDYTPIGTPSPISEEGWKMIHQAFADKFRMVQEKANIKIKKENEEVKTNEDAEQEVPKLLN